jgi:hypothetical protein
VANLIASRKYPRKDPTVARETQAMFEFFANLFHSSDFSSRRH